MKGKKYIQTILPKVLFVFSMSSLSLYGLYLLSRNAFADIYHSLGILEKPNEKLGAVNRLFATISASEKSYHDLVANGSARNLSAFIRRSDAITRHVDSLKELCTGNEYQTLLLDSLSMLLFTRKAKLLDYVRYRQGLYNRDLFQKEINAIDSLIAEDDFRNETTIFSNREKIVKTRIDTIEQEEEKKGILKKIFKPKRKNYTTVEVSDVTINENSDTINTFPPDEIYAKAQQLMQNISSRNISLQREFVKREAAINRFEKEFRDNLTALLTAVELDILSQTSNIQNAARDNMSASINRIKLLLLMFAFVAIIFIIWIAFDISKTNKYRRLLELARNEAEELSVSRQVLLSNVSHEIRTPLQSVIGYTELLKQSPGNPEYIQAISHASMHLKEVTNEVLDYSSIEAGKFVVNQEVFSLKGLMMEINSMLRPQAEIKGLNFSTVIENEIPDELIGDSLRLKQILINLAGNAIKYTDKGEVIISLGGQIEDNTFMAQFSIKDTGRGLPLSMQEKIFERFEQAGLNPAPNANSTGLGLAITRALVEALDGTIQLQSEPGVGSTFLVSIPFEVSKDKKSQDIGLNTHSFSFAGEVWVVEDDIMILELIARIMQLHHIRYRCFGSVGELLNETNNSLPDLVITDITMPEQGGIDLLRAIQKLPGTTIPVVALTAHALPDEQKHLIESGFEMVLVKPFTTEGLLRTIAAFDAGCVHTVADGERLYDLKQWLPGLGIDDDEIVQQILKQYVQDTVADLDRLMMAEDACDTGPVAELLHRMAGRTSQLGFTAIGNSLRKLELDSRKGKAWKSADANRVLSALQDLINDIKQQIKEA